MLPYLHAPELKIGPFTPHVFGALVVIAVVTGKVMVERRAQKRGFPRNVASGLLIWMMASGFLCAHLTKALLDGTPLANPLLLFRVWDGLYSFGGIAGGILGILCFAARYRLSRRLVWRFLDVVAYAFPFAWIFGRMGCSLVHDHPGIPTTSWLGVRYPVGPRFDLGLLELLFTVLVAGAFHALDRRKRPDGFYLGLLLLLYGPFRLLLDGLHVEKQSGLPFSPDGCFSLAAALFGMAVIRYAAREPAQWQTSDRLPFTSPP